VEQRSTPRGEWPKAALRRVHAELSAATPKWLLQRELWCAAAGAAQGWERRQRFARSCAVMSVAGHVLGLGDRHLDNLLVDMASGELVHIDYNVCFDKGARLKVPECVPFRLTRTLLTAMGPQGCEGAFRRAAEAALAVLRGQREVRGR
jgi:PI-3-kinase-related kinase SMG-1